MSGRVLSLETSMRRTHVAAMKMALYLSQRPGWNQGRHTLGATSLTVRRTWMLIGTSFCDMPLTRLSTHISLLN
jgi:hypothetical protein